MIQTIGKYWKPLTFVPLIVLVLSSAFLINNILTTGSFMQRSPELIGGKIITLQVSDISKINIPYKFRTTGSKDIIIELPFDADENTVLATIGTQTDILVQPSIRTVGPVIGEIFWKQTQFSIVIAFLLMSVVVFILFRSIVPSSIVILAAITDLVVTITILDIIGIDLSLHVLAALLMLIGYSVDSDIVLTTNMLRGGGILGAMKTGLTMSATAIVAFLALNLVSTSIILQDMSLAIMIGLLIDIPSTYLTNAGILRIWVNRRERA